VNIASKDRNLCSEVTGDVLSIGSQIPKHIDVDVDVNEQGPSMEYSWDLLGFQDLRIWHEKQLDIEVQNGS